MIPNPARLLVTITLAAWSLKLADLRVVVTPSVPRGVYKTMPLVSPLERGLLKRGEYVCVEPKSPEAPEALRHDYEGFSVLMKRVGAVAGDRVELTPEGVNVNGQVLPLSKHLGHDSEGRPLPRPALAMTLRVGQVWLTSEHERGYDSRYFGPVSTNALSCTGEPWWTW